MIDFILLRFAIIYTTVHALTGIDVDLYSSRQESHQEKNFWPPSGPGCRPAATPSMSLLTDTDVSAYCTRERYSTGTLYTCPPLIARSLLLSNDVQASVFSDILSRVESGFNHFRSVIHDPCARVAALSVVDKEIDASKLRLRSLINDLAPISLLPSEILALVFRFLSLEDPPCSGKQNLGWMRATHVCRLWRQVALGDSSLWTKISGLPTNRELISEMLARARNAPLSIDINLGGKPNPESLPMFPPHLSYTCKLRLRGLSILHSDSVRGIYTQEAPTLEHFELQASVASPALTFRELDGTTLFKGWAPRLRTISLSGVFIPWSLIPRGQLTQLEISFSSEAPIFGAHGDLNQLIDLLVNCPELEVLVLESCLPPQPTHFPFGDFGQAIHLPRLSRLCLGGSSLRIANLLKKLKLHTSTILHLRLTSENDSIHDHFLLFVVSAHLQSPVPVEFKQLSVTLGFGRLVVTASTSFPKSRICQSQDFESNMDDEFVLSFDRMPRKGLIEQVCKMLPISNLESLSICAVDVVVPVFDLDWIELFERCPKVTTLQAVGKVTSSLVRALTTRKLPNTRHGCKEKKSRHDSRDRTLAQPVKSTVPHTNALILPKLAFLSLKSLDFRESILGSNLLDVVEDGLRQRKVAYGAPLKTLFIDDCTISTKRAKALEKLVEKLDWDGDEGNKFEDRNESGWELGWEDDYYSDTTQGEQ